MVLVLAVAATAVTPAFATSTLTTAQQERLTVIKTKGDQEISRRLSELNKLAAVISSATKLSSTDKTTLSNEVSTTVSGLTALKTTLDNETTLEAAKTDVQSIVNEYRVYVLVVPKVHLLKVADDQLAAAAKLTDAATKLQARLTSLKTSGKDVTTLQTALDDMTTSVATAQKIASSIESGVINLQPSDYNSDHTLLTGDSAQLKTAHTALVQARKDAEIVFEGIKALSN